jgi:hypothetical protein
MIAPITPGLFWSDITLGCIAAYCGALTYKHSHIGSFMFASAGVAAWLGAFFHGYVGSTAMLSGRLLWLLTIVCFAASSAALMQYSAGDNPRVPYPAVIFFGYCVFAALINNDFLWTSVLQGCADIVYGFALLRAALASPKKTSDAAILWYVAYIGVTAVSAIIASANSLPNLTVNPLVIFHLTEIPAVVLLYQSVRENSSTDDSEDVVTQQA